jgi:hypothetical protein
MLTVLSFILWCLLANPGTPHAIATAAPYRYVYVNADGSARELHAEERTYLEKEYNGGDGDMPYVKDSYSERNGWGELNGFLKRSDLPARTTIHPAPAENPNRGMSKDEYIAWLRNKGVEVVENSDGSITTMAKPRR